MSMLREIRRNAERAESAGRATDFARLAHAILRNDGSLAKLGEEIERPRSMSGGLGLLSDIVKNADPQRISRASLQKTAAGPNSLGTDTAFAQYTQISNGFLGSLVNAGAFDAMVSSMLRLPLQLANVGAVSTGAAAYQIVEGQMKPLSRLSVTNQNSDPLKAICALVLSKELVRFGPPGTLQFIETELRKAVAKVTDEIFLAVVSAGVSAASSTGATGEAARADIWGMLASVTLGQDSAPFIVTTSQVAKRWSMLSDQHGVATFPLLGPQGGEVAPGLPVVVSDAVASGVAYLIDAAAIGANPGEIVLAEFGEASLQFNDAPDSPPGASTPNVSLWQQNLTAIRLERYFVVERLRANCVAAVSGVGGASGNSPP